MLVSQPVRPGYRDLPAGHGGAGARRDPGARVVVVPIVRDARLHPYQALVRLGPARASHRSCRTTTCGPSPGPQADAPRGWSPTREGVVEVGPPEPGGAAAAGGASTARSSPPTCSSRRAPGRRTRSTTRATRCSWGWPSGCSTHLGSGRDGGRPRPRPAALGHVARCTPRSWTCSAWTRRRPARAGSWTVRRVEDGARRRGAAALVRGAPRGRRGRAGAARRRDDGAGPVTAVQHLVVGPAGHGVVRYAELLLAAVGMPADHVLRVPRRAGADDVPGSAGRAGRGSAAGRPGGGGAPPPRVHLHVTDHLLGRGPEEALAVVARARPAGPGLAHPPRPAAALGRCAGRASPRLLRGAGRGRRRRGGLQRARGPPAAGRRRGGRPARRSGWSRSPSLPRGPGGRRGAAAGHAGPSASGRVRPGRPPVGRWPCWAGCTRARGTRRCWPRWPGCPATSGCASWAGPRPGTATCSTAWPRRPARAVGRCRWTAGSTTTTCPYLLAPSPSRSSPPATCRPRRR